MPFALFLSLWFYCWIQGAEAINCVWGGPEVTPEKSQAVFYNISFGEREDTYCFECCPCEICGATWRYDRSALPLWMSLTAWKGHDGWKVLGWHLLSFYFTNESQARFPLLPQRGLRLRSQTIALRIFHLIVILCFSNPFRLTYTPTEENLQT